MEDNKLEQAEDHLRAAERRLEVAEVAEKHAAEEMHVAEEEERAALQDTKAALKEIEEAQHHSVIHFKVDGEEYETRKKELTPDKILRDFAERDPATHYLKELAPEARSFKDQGRKEIKMVDGMCFVIMSTGPMQVSYGE